jgi:hypothetical protein
MKFNQFINCRMFFYLIDGTKIDGKLNEVGTEGLTIYECESEQNGFKIKHDHIYVPMRNILFISY